MTGNELDKPAIPIRLGDGAIADVRPVSPHDRELITEGLSQMSVKSRFSRFGSGISSLSNAELRYLTEMDQVSHVAWGATIDGAPAGVGRYIVGHDAEAEIAITVVDRFQQRGLGRVLFEALAASARAAGIETFRFSIEPWNRSVLRMLPGVEVELDDDAGMLAGRLAVADLPVGEHESELVSLLDQCRQRRPAV